MRWLATLIVVLSLLLVPEARGAKPCDETCRDTRARQVIAFFVKHPKLAATPAGAREMWRAIARLNRRQAILAETVRSLQAIRASPTAAIRYVFGPYADQALRVSYCETGGTYSVWAENGQYKGLFQMGENERKRYGHGSDALTQARSAYAYFDDSGRDWSPWECKP